MIGGRPFLAPILGEPRPLVDPNIVPSLFAPGLLIANEPLMPGAAAMLRDKVHLHQTTQGGMREMNWTYQMSPLGISRG